MAWHYDGLPSVITPAPEPKTDAQKFKSSAFSRLKPFATVKILLTLKEKAGSNALLDSLA